MDNGNVGATVEGIEITNANAGINSGGGISNVGTLTLNNSTVSKNTTRFGGGIANSGDLTLNNSTVSGNSGVFGAGIYNQSTGLNTDLDPAKRIVIRNSTISGNEASDTGGGVFNYNGLTIIENTTITNNTAPSGEGAGVASDGSNRSRTDVHATIISGNTETDVDLVNRSDDWFDSLGSNLIGDGNAVDVNTFNEPGDQTGVADPGLGNLADNGGPTKTHAVQTGSPALDAVQATGVTGAATSEPCGVTEDQRGVARPQDGDEDGIAKCDIGSFELDGASDTTKPIIKRLSPKPGAKIKDRTPKIKATVKDNATDLAKADIQLFVDGKKKNKFKYNQAKTKLVYKSKRLSYKRHKVKIVAEDASGNVATKSWRFKVKRR